MIVSSAKPPLIEFDGESGGAYVRFSKKPVAQTVERSTEGLIVTIDLDKSGEVVGVEGVGFDKFSISALLKAANVRAEHVDFAKAQLRSTPRHLETALA